MIHRHSPLIGITADTSGASNTHSKRPKDATLFLPERYLTAVERAGGIPVVLPANRAKSAVGRLLGMLHGLILSGGDFDIHPRYYGERRLKELGQIKAARTEFELEIAGAALKRDLPVLAICGGAQALNVALGGSLYQDIASQLKNTGVYEHTSKNPDGGHPIRVEPGTRLFAIVKRSSLKVNTRHHQAIRRLGRGLIVNAVAGDGVIEGIESTEHTFVLGLQWHPEALAPGQPPQHRIFSSFVELCSRQSRSR